jgi:hypothetical protein
MQKKVSWLKSEKEGDDVLRLEPDSDEEDIPEMESGLDGEEVLGLEQEGLCGSRRMAEKERDAYSLASRRDVQAVTAT